MNGLQYASGNGMLEPGPISKAFGGVLPNRSGLSSAGSMGSGLGGSRHGHASGVGATNTLMSAVGGLAGSSGNRGGMEIYYKRRAGSVQGRRSKGSSNLSRGPTSTHSKLPGGSLLSSLADKRFGGGIGKGAPLDFSSNIGAASSGSGSTYGNSVAAAAVAAAAAVMDVQQRLRQPVGQAAPSLTQAKQETRTQMARKEKPVQVASPSPPPPQDSTRTRAAKKSVRWSETLTSCNPEKREKEGLTPASILAVGGMAKTNSNLGSNTGVGGLAGGGGATALARAPSQVPMKGSMSPIRVQVESADTAILLINSSSVGSMVGNNNLQDLRSGSQTRPHSSGSLSVGGGSSTSTDTSLVSNNGNSVVANAKHKPLLEMRRAMKANNSAQRPSLSEQLAAIGANAGALTASIRANAGMENDSTGDPPVVVLPAKSFTVGTLSCRYPSPARFYRDRIEYVFHHPYEASEISMTMHYPDMLQTQLAAGKLRFKLPRRLSHFPADFNPSNPTHAIVIELGTMAAQTILKEKVMPLMRPQMGHRI